MRCSSQLFAIPVILLAMLASVGHAADPPNILFILADDLAWSDPGCYGHPWHTTPHIDRLAADGLQFTDAYAPAPICSASRAGFLTGKTPARLHFEFVTKERPGRQELDAETPLRAPPFTLNLPLDEETIAERLAALGYETAFFGKWHLNAHYQRYLGWSPTHGPPQQGFQVAVEDFGGHPYSWGGETPPAIETVNEFPADSMVDRAADFLRQDHERPFFLMVSSFYVHTPVRTPCRWLVEKYEQLIPTDAPNRERRVRYAAFVETLDQYIGRILEALDESGLRDQTLVVFTSDNGGHPEYAANGPLRGSKWNLYEGGIREPLIARWPGLIPDGAVCHAPVVGYDLLPTFTDVAGGEAEDVDGISLTPLFEDPDRQPERDLIWHFPYYHPERGYADARDEIGVNDFAISRTRPQSALRWRQFKLLRFYEDDRAELYNLSEDVSEQHDLSFERADFAAELQARLTRHLEDMHARYPEVVRPGGAD